MFLLGALRIVICTKKLHLLAGTRLGKLDLLHVGSVLLKSFYTNYLPCITHDVFVLHVPSA